MRSPIGPVLAIVGLATTVVLVQLLFQNLSIRSDLEAARADVAELTTAVESMEPGLTNLDLNRQIADLEGRIRELLVANGGSPGTDPGASGGIAQQLEEISDQIAALDRRLDEICENVPVC
jgi:uncharacterized protein involved in exopolysaccharide biosynthesis